jgi:hypothetical protein
MWNGCVPSKYGTQRFILALPFDASAPGKVANGTKVGRVVENRFAVVAAAH